MRVLICNQYYPPDTAATARMLEDVAEALAEHHAVEVIAGEPTYAPQTSDSPRRVKATRVRSLRFGRTSLSGRAVSYASYLVLALVTGLRRPRPDVVVALTDPPVVGVVGAILARRFRVPFVFICHDVHPDIGEALGLFRNPALLAPWRTANRFVRRSATAIVVVGRDMRDKFVAAGVPADRLHVVPTWARADRPDADDRATVRHRFGWDGAFVVMHAGNMGLAQNLTTVVEVAVRLPEARVVFLGDGPAEPAVRDAVARAGLDNVELLGRRPVVEAQKMMAAADLHVVSLVPGLWGCAAPSKTYGVMAASRPFVAAVDPGSEPATIAAELDCGTSVPAGDGEALAAAIEGLRAADLDAMGARGRAGYEERYTPERCVPELCDVVLGAAA